MAPRHLFLMLIVNILWGLNFVATKWVVMEIPPIFSGALRFFIVFILILPFLKLVPGRMKDVLLATMFTGGLQMGLLFYGISLAGDMSSVAVVSIVYVPLSTLLAVIFLHEKVGWRRILGIAAAFSGIMILGFDPRAFQYIDGLLLVMLGGLIFAIGSLLVKRVADVHPMTLLAWMSAIAVPISVALSLAFESGQWEAVMAATSRAHASILYGALFATLIGHTLIYYFLQRYPVSTVTPLTLLGPILGVPFSIWLLAEEVSARMILGAVVAFVGVVIIVLREGERGVENPISAVIEEMPEGEQKYDD